MSAALTPWRPPLFEALASPTARTVLHLKAPSLDGRASLRAFLDDPTRWRYAVVDEMVDEMVGLVVSPWPLVDEAGRLRLAADNGTRAGALAGTFTVHVSEPSLHAFLVFQRNRARSLGLIQGAPDVDPVTRGIRIGDAFALGAAPTRDPAPTSVPRERLWVSVEGRATTAAWLRGVPATGRSGKTALVLDLGVDAREAARVAYYAAMAPELQREVDNDIIQGAVLEGLAVAAERAGRAGPG